MNHITVHGKIVKKAEMKLIEINKEPCPVAVFTVVDIGLPYQQIEPIFFQVNYFFQFHKSRCLNHNNFRLYFL